MSQDPAAVAIADKGEFIDQTLYSHRRSAVAARWAGWLLLLIAGTLDRSTLDTGLLPSELEGGDLITHQYAQVEARPSNAPGYPFYTMGGWLWFHVGRWISTLIGNPLPNPMVILSSYSTLWALLALWLFYRILLALSRSTKRPSGHWPLAWLLAIFYAVTYFFWYYATTTEQYSSAVAHTLAIFYIYLQWQDRVDRDRPAGGSTQQEEKNHRDAGRYLLLLAFLCGLSFAHMVTVVMIVPPLIVAVLWTKSDLLRRGWIILGTVMAAALPLVGYIFVYVRGTAHPEWWGAGTGPAAANGFGVLYEHLKGQEELSWGLEPGAPILGNGFPQLIWQELSVPLLVLGLIGIALFWGQRRDGRKLGLLLYGTLLLYLILCWVDRFGNWFQVILPAYPLILCGFVPLAIWAMDKLSKITLWLSSLPLLLLVVAIFWRVDASLPAANSRNRPEDTALQRPALLLDQPLPSGATLFAEKDDALGLHYLIEIWGIRPDLKVVSSPQANRVLADGGMVLSTVPTAPLLSSELALSEPITFRSLTADWVVLDVGNTLEAREPMVRLERSLGDDIMLVGYTVEVGPNGLPVLKNVEPTLNLILYWQLESDAAPSNWAISVRPLRDGALLLGRDGMPIQQDRTGPVHGLRHFGELPVGVPIADVYSLPGDKGVDGFQVVLYRVEGSEFENLAVLDWTDPEVFARFHQR